MSFNSGLLISVIIISALFIGFSGVLFYTATVYDVQVDTKYQTMFDKYDEAMLQVNNSRTVVAGGEVNPTGFFQTAYPSTIATAKQLISAGDLFNSLIAEVPNIIPIPAIFITALVGIVGLFSVLGFIAFVSWGRTP